MKPARFTYHDPATLEEALELLGQYGDEAKVLAGGQSLVPLLNFRLARPAHLVDLNRLDELKRLELVDGRLAFGAMVRQRSLERSQLIAERCPMITQAMPFVGHSQIRNRGTLGGSLAHADPAAELPAIMVACEAHFTLRSLSGERVVSAEDFFRGQLTTALNSDEILVNVDAPVAPPQTGSSVKEVAMRLGDFALAGVATSISLADDGRIQQARIVCFGVEDRPKRQLEAEQSLHTAIPGDDVFKEAGRIVTARITSFDDIHASAAYRRRVSGVLTQRALAASLATIKQAVV